MFRVLIIGNSFSQNATTYLPQLVEEGGHSLELGRAELSGCSLQKHWEMAAASEADPNDPMGKPYNGQSLKELLLNGKWDLVTMQQYSRLSGDAKTYQPYADNLYKYIKAIQPHAKMAVHQTWAYRSDAITFGLVNGEKRAATDAEMYENLKANYIELAKRMNADIIPSGEAFWQIRNNLVWAYKPGIRAEEEAVLYPELPAQLHSLNVGYKWEADKKLVFDPNHASVAGCYLGSLVWYHFLFGTNLNQVQFKPEDINEDFAGQLKKAAMAAFEAPGIGQK